MKSRLTVVAALLATTTAFAADLPSRKAIPAAATQRPLFTGLYAGAQAGYLEFVGLTDAYYAPTNFRYASPSATGGSFAGGGHIGYDWRFGNFVAGLVGDVTGASASANTTVPTFAAGRVVNSYNHVGVQGSVRGRIGYAFDPVLLYVTGGLNLASGQNRLSTVYGARTQNFVSAGPTLGVGVEYAINDRWNINVEGRTAVISGFGRQTPTGTPLVTVRQLSGGNLITAGVSYRFGF
jgi:outer membrane immunogenic protein